MPNQYDDPEGLLLGLFSPDDVAQRWGCSKGWLANLRSAGRGPSYVRLGSRIAYRVRDIVAFEDAATVETVPA